MMLHKSKHHNGDIKAHRVSDDVAKNHINGKISKMEKNPFREEEMKMSINYRSHGHQSQKFDISNEDNHKRDIIRKDGRINHNNDDVITQERHQNNKRRKSIFDDDDENFNDSEEEASDMQKKSDRIGQSMSVGVSSLTDVGELIPRKVEFLKYLHVHTIKYPAGAIILNPKHLRGIKRERDGEDCVGNGDDLPAKKVTTAHVWHQTRSCHPDDCEGDPRSKEIPSVLFPISSLSRIVFVSWQEVGNGYGGGLVNYGNTCFANAILQCFAFTPTIAQFFLKFGRASTADGIKGNGVVGGRRNSVSGSYDFASAVSEVIHNIHRTRGGVYKPAPIVGYLSGIRKGFRIGEQSDAHEFAQCLIGKCQQIFVERLGKGRKIIPIVGNTSPLMRVIGGYIRSQVSWSKREEISILRNAEGGGKPLMLSAAQDLEMDSKLENVDRLVSNVYDMFTMLNLSIPGKVYGGGRGGTPSTIESCVAEFFSKEKLKGRIYTTPRQVQVHAFKQFSLHILPPTLILHLKRFDNNGLKIHRNVSFGPTLDMLPYCSSNSDIKEAKYQLCGVAVHEGGSVDYGHYYAYVRGKNGLWYCCNDSNVRHVSVDQVMGCQAYMLFYTLSVSSFTKQIANPTAPENGQSQPKKKPLSPMKQSVSAPSDAIDSGVDISEADIGRIMLQRRQHEEDINKIQQNSHESVEGEAERLRLKREKDTKDIATESDEEESSGQDDDGYCGMTSSISAQEKGPQSKSLKHHPIKDPNVEVGECVVSPNTPVEFTAHNFTSLVGDEGLSDINLELEKTDNPIDSNESDDSNYSCDENEDPGKATSINLKELILKRKAKMHKSSPLIQQASDIKLTGVSAPEIRDNIRNSSSVSKKPSVLPTMSMSHYGGLVKSLVKYSAPDQNHANGERNGECEGENNTRYDHISAKTLNTIPIRGSIHDVLHSEEPSKRVDHYHTLERKKHHGAFHKKQRDETYARELDKGKTKKVMRRVSDEEKFCGPNIFQLASNQSKNKNRISFSEDIESR